MTTIRPLMEKYGLDEEILPLDAFYMTGRLPNQSFRLPFETEVNRVDFFLSAQRMWPITVVTSILYITLIVMGQKIMSKKKPYVLRLPLILWNIMMALFSTFGFVRVGGEMFYVLKEYGFFHSVCTSSFMHDPIAVFWITTFVKSKFVELIDTAFIIMRKKPVVFLHWYHHATVLMFSWHAAKELASTGRWYIWMNYGAHSLMYTYYAARAMNFHVPRWTQMTVTIFQISQMVMGVILSYTVWQAKTIWHLTCHQSWANLAFSTIIYLSYFVLFAKYFIQIYIIRKGTKVYNAMFTECGASKQCHQLKHGHHYGQDEKKVK